MKLNVIDDLIGVEVHKVQGSPVEMNLIIVSQDMVAVGSVATAVIGIDPRKVNYLRLAEERGLGVSNLKEIEVLGKNITEEKRKFKLPNKSNGYSIAS